ncbi:hypothetical protein VKT23_006644 [Stygiomarasmius scandens]|uniref:Uncharacterized protein n=1 Tax=Marasmiellus scandens TaxID=2682957 RepID=A0ABR1JRP7_9AGAR
MTFGILEDKYLKDVPGTALLSDLGIVRGQQVTIDEAGTLKKGTGRHAHIILIPQPSDDPADPLNWPRWKKEACFWTLAFAASLDGALSPMTGPGYVLLSGQFGVSVDEVASSFGAILLGLACFMYVDFSMKVSLCSNLNQAIPGLACREVRSQNRLPRFSDSGKDWRLASFS